MPSFEITASRLKSKAEELRALNSRFKTEIMNLEMAEESLRNKWSGEANDKFHTIFINDKEKIDNFGVLIEQYIEAMATICNLYEKTESFNCDNLNIRRR